MRNVHKYERVERYDVIRLNFPARSTELDAFLKAVSEREDKVVPREFVEVVYEDGGLEARFQTTVGMTGGNF